MDDSRTLRERGQGRLWFGVRPEEQWSIVDPSDPFLEDALHRMRYAPAEVTDAERYRILAAAEAFQHLCCYPLAGVAVGQLRAIRKAVRDA